MAFKPRRQAKYRKLKEQGFLPFEAFAFSKVSPKVPYLKLMIDDRKGALREAKRLKFSKKEWTLTITDVYKEKFLGKETIGWWGRPFWKADPWAYFRSWEERYKERYPDYTSPWQKKKRKRTDFIAKFERGATKYPRGRHYK